MDITKINSTYSRIRSKRWLNTIVILSRYLIAFAFIPSGLKKIMGLRFTQIGIDNPIGFFFEGLFQSGIYWNFIGWAQVVAAFLLMTQRFATLGTLFFFFIISNIWVITISLHFTGTWIITSLLLFAIIMMLLWDFNKLKFIFYPDNYSVVVKDSNYPTHNRIWIIAGFILFGLSLVGSFLLEMQQYGTPIFFYIWFASIIVTVVLAIYLNRKGMKTTIF
ncbi:MAG: DoxX family protein [Saprospiraceae bacterium]|nr:hypothetical protein [Candidatus Brachybacter algidus]MBK8748417.1 DoxX family protein [Candidatus Brachybacter algidus]